MAEEIKNYHFRRVTSEDKEAVLNIDRNVHNGYDFLPAYYDVFLYMPNAYPAAIVSDDKIAGFIVAHIIDGGETAVIRAARVSPDYRGYSLLWHLYLHISKWAYRKGVTSVKEVSQRPPDHRVEKVLFSWDNIIVSLEPQNLRICAEDMDLARGLATVSDEILFDLYKDSGTMDYIAPNGYLLTFMVPSKPIEENLYCLRGIDGCANIYSDVNVNLRERNGLMSCCSRFKSPNEFSAGYIHCLDIYGNDTRCLRKHLIRHLMDLREKSEGVISMHIVLPEHIPSDVIFQVLSQCYPGVDRKQFNPLNGTLYLQQVWSRRATQQNKL